MSQNLVSQTPTDEKLATTDQALAALEGMFAQLVVLDGDERGRGGSGWVASRSSFAGSS